MGRVAKGRGLKGEGCDREGGESGHTNPDRCSEIRCIEDDLLAPKQRAAKSIEQDSDF